MFVFDQKSGKNVYVYEIRSYWDSDKKQPRQKRIYLGKRDTKTGELIPAKSTSKQKLAYPKIVFNFGEVYFLKNLFDMHGISSLLKKHFSNIAEEILNLCYYDLIENNASYMAQDWFESTLTDADINLSSQRISELFELIGNNDYALQRFMLDWINSNKKYRHLLIDFTSFS